MDKMCRYHEKEGSDGCRVLKFNIALLWKWRWRL